MSQSTGQPGGGAEPDDETPKPAAARGTSPSDGPSVAPPSYGTPSFGPGNATPGMPASLSQQPGASVGTASVLPPTGTRAPSTAGLDPAIATAPSPPDPGARDWREAWREARSSVGDGSDAGGGPLRAGTVGAPGAAAAGAAGGTSATTTPAGRSTAAVDGESAVAGGGFRSALTTGLARAKTLAAGGVAAVTSAASGPAASTAAPAGTSTGTPGAAAGAGVATSAAAGGAATTVLPRPQATSSPPRAPATQPAARQRSPGRPVRRVRRAHLKLTRVDPWTIMKVSFMLAIAFGIMTIVAVAVVWSMLDAAGVFVSLNETVESVTGEGGGALGFDLMSWVAFDRVLGVATLIAVVDVVLITALATLGAFLYNLAASLLGGVEVTFVEDHH